MIIPECGGRPIKFGEQIVEVGDPSSEQRPGFGWRFPQVRDAVARLPEASEGIVKLFVDEGVRGSLGSGWGGCDVVVRRLWGPVR